MLMQRADDARWQPGIDRIADQWLRDRKRRQAAQRPGRGLAVKRLNTTKFQTVGAVVSVTLGAERSNWPLRMRCVNSTPEIVVAAFLNRLKPSIAFVLDLTFRWSCSIRLFRYLRIGPSFPQAVGRQPSSHARPGARRHTHRA
jgi:hypothetical protein